MRRPRCRQCGGTVSHQFARVFGDGAGDVHACLDCSPRGAVMKGAAAKPEFEHRAQRGGRS